MVCEIEAVQTTNRAYVRNGSSVDGSLLARDFLDVMQRSGAVICPAFDCGGDDRCPCCSSRIGSQSKARARGAKTQTGFPNLRFDRFAGANRNRSIRRRI